MNQAVKYRHLAVFTTAALLASGSISSLSAQVFPPPQGINNYEVVTKETKLSYPAIFQMDTTKVKEGVAAIDCPTTKIALGGGAGVIDPSNAVLVESKPSLRNGKAVGWFARFAGANGPGSATVSISVICAVGR
jgi:hypothetical protein